MATLWDRASLEAREGKKRVEEDQRELGEGGGEKRSDAL